MKSSIILASALLAAPFAATAQTATPAPAAPAAAAARPTVGATVLDQAGTPVGTIATITPEAIVIDTGTNKVPVPPSAVGTNAKGLYTAATKAQLDAAVAQQKAQAQAAMTPGAAVSSADGQALGTIKAADAQFVTLTTTDKREVRLPATGFTAGPDGVKVGFTAAQFEQAVAGGKPSAPAETSGEATADAIDDAADAAASASPSPGTTPAPASTPKGN